VVGVEVGVAVEVGVEVDCPATESGVLSTWLTCASLDRIVTALTAPQTPSGRRVAAASAIPARALV
jgi:hypothetical protein